MKFSLKSEELRGARPMQASRHDRLNCRIPQQICMETLANPTFCSPYTYTYVICVLLVHKSPKRISRTWTLVRSRTYVVQCAAPDQRKRRKRWMAPYRTRRQANRDLRPSAIVWNVGNVGTGGKKQTSRAIVGNVGTVDKTLESYCRKRRKRWNRRQELWAIVGNVGTVGVGKEWKYSEYASFLNLKTKIALIAESLAKVLKAELPSCIWAFQYSHTPKSVFCWGNPYFSARQ